MSEDGLSDLMCFIARTDTLIDLDHERIFTTWLQEFNTMKIPY